MRTTAWLIFALVLGLTTAQAQKATWNLSRDLRASNNEISFNQGSKMECGTSWKVRPSGTFHRLIASCRFTWPRAPACIREAPDDQV